MTYSPPFTLNDTILVLVAEIAQKVGRVEAYDVLSRSPNLRKENRVRTIHSSLAIENNTLSIEQVTAVVEGRRVLAPPKDLLEVQNAIATYEALDTFVPTSVSDLLRAHKMLMGGLIDEAGMFRSGNVGVFDGGELIHAGTPARYVTEVVSDLFGWLKSTETHPLVASCVFHYEFEFIHPFKDGNGRMGRLWQTLILSKWNKAMEWLPVESLVKDNQAAYYSALARSDDSGNSTEFVQFMLEMISSALDEAIGSGGATTDVGINVGINVGIMNEATEQREHLISLVRENPTMTMQQMAAVLGISKRQVERIVSRLKGEGRLIREGGRRNGYWEVR